MLHPGWYRCVVTSPSSAGTADGLAIVEVQGMVLVVQLF